MKRTSYPRRVSRSWKVAVVATLALAAVIYVAFERGRASRGTRALTDLPRTARAVLRVDTQALERSAAAATLTEAFLPREALSELASTCGLDPLGDLSEVTVWVRGSDRAPFESFGVMLSGSKVDAARIAACHQRLVEARGGAVVRLDAPSGPLLASDDRRSAIALIDSQTAVTGSVETVAEALAVRRGLLPPLSERAPVASLWREVSPGAAIAAVVHPPEHWAEALRRGTASKEAESSALDGIEAVALSVRPGPRQTLEALLDAETPELAEQSATLLRGIASSPPESVEAPWDEVLRSAEVATRGARVHVRLDLSSLAKHPR